MKFLPVFLSLPTCTKVSNTLSYFDKINETLIFILSKRPFSMNTPTEIPHTTPHPKNSNTTLPMIIYALYLMAFIAPFTALIAVIMAYINRSDATNFLQSHYQFQIRTFWIGLLYLIVGSLLTIILIGWIILLFCAIWLIIRSVKGFKYLNNQHPIPHPTSWMFG